MTEGRPSRLIVRFSLPLLAGNILQQMYNLVDSLVVGNFVGKEALAAVGSTFILGFLITSLFSGLGLGMTIIISRCYGAGNRDKVRSTIDTSYVTALVGAIPVTILGLLATRPLLHLVNTPAGATMEMSAAYLSIIFIGMIGTFGYNLNAGILQGLGDSVSSLVFLAVATALNIGLDLLFVAVFGWGVAGVAWATIISQMVSFILGAFFIVRKLRLTTLRIRDLRFEPVILAESVHIGLPNGVLNILFSLGNMAIQRLINGHGPTFMAAYSISGRLDSLAFMPIASFSSAVITFTGQNVGAGKLDRVRYGFRATHLMSGAVCLAVSLAVTLSSYFLMSLFTRDLEVIEIGVGVLRRVMPTYVLLSVLFITSSVLRGAGDIAWPFAAQLVSFLFVRISSAYLFDHFFGKGEIAWCYGLGWVFGVLIAVPRYLSGKWKGRYQGNAGI